MAVWRTISYFSINRDKDEQTDGLWTSSTNGDAAATAYLTGLQATRARDLDSYGIISGYH